MNSNTRESKLIRACKKCDFKLVQELVVGNKTSNLKRISSKDANKAQQIEKTQFDLNFREPKFEMTPLMIASLRGSRDIVLHLINHGADVSLSDTKGNTALQLACMKQRFHVIDALLQNKANPNDVNKNGWNCLISAVNNFHEDSATMLLLLLQTHAKTDHKDDIGLMCIDHAVRKNKINAIRVILNFNPKLSQQCVRALINAAIKGYFDIVLLLLNYGVNPNKIDAVTGTGPLHEAVRYNDIKDEKSQQERLKIVQYLAMYGADPELPNQKNETPISLANLKPPGVSDKYIQSLMAFNTNSFKEPKYVNLNGTSLKDMTKKLSYPLLKPHLNWTRNDRRFCSNPSSIKDNSVTNLIDGNPKSMWTVPGKSLNWVVFDLKAVHVITKIRIYGWKSKEMPSECFLQVSNSIEGPWNNVQKFICDMAGSNVKTKAGVPLDFDGFNAIARYWRLVIGKNHGASVTSFHGVEFFGYDYRIVMLIEQLKLTEYEDMLIENDFNQIEALTKCTYDKFEKLTIENQKDREKLWNYILEFQKKVQPLKKLDWFNEPPPYGLVGQVFPAFSVISTSFLSDTLQLISHGGANISGETSVDMEPGAMNDPSMAIFRKIAILNSGKFLLEIRSVKNPNINISSQPIQIFEAGDPEYEKLVSQMPFSTHNRSSHSADTDEEDDVLERIYGLADFSEQKKSNLKINKWRPKSHDSTINENDLERSSIINNNDVYLVDPNSKANGSTKHSPRNKSSPRTTRFSDLTNTIDANLHVDVDYNDIEYDEYNTNYSSPTQKNSILKQSVKSSSSNLLMSSNSAYEEPPKKNHLFSAHLYSLKANQAIEETEKEYEIQTTTLDFSDELSISSHDQIYLQRLNNYPRHEIEPKTEARVFVNNPEIVVSTHSPRQIYELVEDPSVIKQSIKETSKLSPSTRNSSSINTKQLSLHSSHGMAQPLPNKSHYSSQTLELNSNQSSPSRRLYTSINEPPYNTQINLSYNHPNYSIKSPESTAPTLISTGSPSIRYYYHYYFPRYKHSINPILIPITTIRSQSTPQQRLSTLSSSSTKNKYTSNSTQQSKSFKSDSQDNPSRYSKINIEKITNTQNYTERISLNGNTPRLSFVPPSHSSSFQERPLEPPSYSDSNDFNINEINAEENEAREQPYNINYFNENETLMPPSPSFPPPPPPPPPPLLPIQVGNDNREFLKVKKSSSISQDSNSGKNPLQRELEERLKKKSSSSPRNSSNKRYESIDKNKSDQISIRKESYKANAHLNGHEPYVINIESKSNGANDEIIEFDPNETFTTKAKRALESYKVTKSGSSTSSNESSNDTLGELNIKKGSSKSKHGPLPFRNDSNELKFVD